MCGSSCMGVSLGSSLGRVASFWLAFCFGLVQVPLTAQSTNSGPGLSESSQKELSSLTNLSDEQVFSLKKRKAELQSLNEKIESFRESWLEAELKSMGLSKTVSLLKTDLTATSKELSQSKQDFTDYKASSEERARIDAEAIAKARAERDEAEAILPWVGIGGAIVGALAWAGIDAIF